MANNDGNVPFTVIDGGKDAYQVETSPDSVTILKVPKNHILTKSIDITTDDWEIAAYKSPSKYAAEQHIITNLPDMYNLLSRLTTEKHACIVLGQPIQNVWKNTYGNARKHKGKEPTLEERRISWVPIDIDKVSLPKPSADMSAREIDAHVQNFLNIDYLKNTNRIILLTGSHGKPNSYTAKIRIWYRVNKPVSIASAKAWAGDINTDFKKDRNMDKSVFDQAIYSPSQPIYTATPLFKRNNKKICDPFAQERIVVISDNKLDELPYSKFPTTTKKDEPKKISDYSDMYSEDVLTAVNDAGIIKDKIDENRFSIVCPWEHDHSNPSHDRDTSTAIIIDEDTKCVAFCCLHDSCKNEHGRTTRDFLDWLVREGYLDEKIVLGNEWEGYTVPVREGDALDQSQMFQLRRFAGDDAYVTLDSEILKTYMGFYGYKIAKNIMSQGYECTFRGKSVIISSEGREEPVTTDKIVTDIITSLDSNCRVYKNLINRKGRDELHKVLDSVAGQKAYSPIVNYLTTCLPPYEDKDYIKEMADAVTVAADKQLFELCFRKMLIAACAAADGLKQTPLQFKSGDDKAIQKFENIIVFCGDQGIRKSTYLRRLVPANLQRYFADNRHLNTNDKDSIMQLTSHWIVELGEVGSTLNKSDRDSLKSFMSNSLDQYRKPYAREAISVNRHTVFVASVNEDRFLRDTTGNRRFWPFKILSIDQNVADKVSLDAMWYQAWEAYVGGEKWWLDPEDEKSMGVVQARFQNKNGTIRLFETKYNATAKNWQADGRKMSVVDLYEELYHTSPKHREFLLFCHDIETMAKRGLIKLEKDTSGTPISVLVPPIRTGNEVEVEYDEDYLETDAEMTETIKKKFHLSKVDVELIDDWKVVSIHEVTEMLYGTNESEQGGMQVKRILDRLVADGYCIKQPNAIKYMVPANLKAILNALAL